MKRKILCSGLAIMMASSLMACGSSQSAGGDASTGTEGATQGDMDDAVITIWSPSDKESIENWWAEKIDEWNTAHPDMKAAREAIDRSDSYAYDNKIATAVTSNSLPSIFFVDGPQVSYYAANGLIVPITDYFSDSIDDFDPATQAQCTYDGELYAISATQSGVAFYYNKDLLKECGVDTDDLDSRTIDNPITWSEMAEIAEKCTTDSYVGTHIIMDHGEGIPYALEPMYISEGKDYISDDGTTADGYVNSDESVKTTAFLADLIAKGYANVDPITDEFLNGACATELGGSWDVATLEANATFDWGVTYYPVADDTHKAVSPCGDWSAAISKDCENVEATGEFLKWLMNTENVASYADAIAKPATRASAYDEECMASYAEGPRALFVEQLQNSAAPRPRTPSYATFSTDYAEAMSNIFSEAASTKAVDESYIKEQLDSVADSFAEDYNTYYAN
ncbi:extracellular solute-binding protein [Pseudobutyrivibrio ruminis]|uniref:Extracellular solute-binding protein n=1 Tax=Pseudobutyrivibrio ruminis TaxID=46206 RepID=A0A1H7M899_9FIRM|nr:sugar ABC transporter substrate-binding protein [Pseudobutyrivibrio ruminis]SEL07423.1 extracellular solute-binding protein [Pseudobutyrivibrio ruminis]